MTTDIALNPSTRSEFKSIIEDLNSGARNADIIAEQEVIAFVGASGIGKSTAVNFLLGHKMQKQQNFITLKTTIDIDPKSPIEQRAKIGHTFVATTKYPEFYKTSVPLTINDNSQQIQLLFCDTPGINQDVFADQADPLINLVMEYSLQKIMQKAKGIKLVICLDYIKITNRATEMFNTLRYVERLINGAFSEHKNSMFFLFTNVGDSVKAANVIARLRSHASDLEKEIELNKKNGDIKKQVAIEAQIKNVSADLGENKKYFEFYVNLTDILEMEKKEFYTKIQEWLSHNKLENGDKKTNTVVPSPISARNVFASKL